MNEEVRAEVTEIPEEKPKKRITQAIRVRILNLHSNGLNLNALSETFGFSEAAIEAVIKVGK